MNTSKLQQAEGRGSARQFVLGPAVSLEEPCVERRVIVGRLGGDMRATGLLAPATVSGQLMWHSDASSLPHTVTPSSAASLDPEAPNQVTDLKVMHLFWGIQVWA